MRVRSAAFFHAVLIVPALAGWGSGQETVLVQVGSAMRYLAPGADPGFGTSWTAQGFNDAAWTAGTYGIGYDAGAMIRSPIPLGRDVAYTRARFRIDDLAAVKTVHLGADFDDGYVAWVNGTEVARDNMPPGDPGFGSFADGGHESSNGSAPTYDPIRNVTPLALPALVAGDNVLAIAVWNDDPDSSDLALVPYLSINRPPAAGGTPLCGTLPGTTILTKDESPYFAECDVTVPEGSTLTIEPGVEIRVAAGVEIQIQGQLFADGTPAEPVLIHGANDAVWGGIHIDHGGTGPPRGSILRHLTLVRASTLLDVEDTGTSPIIVEDSVLDRWTGLAVHWDGTHGLILRRCEIGVNTPLAEADHETINGYRAGAIVEHCTFGRRRDYNDVLDLGDTSWGEPVPTIRYNTFLGGDDDAIDLDGSAGWILGNLIMDHWPRPGASGNANGGGITGNDASETVVMNNIVYRCFHGIGYKNGCQPLIANNLVIDCHVGVTLYKDDCGAPMPRATLVNNIIWNNHHEDTGALQNVVLNGRWFPDYCQETADQAVADVSYSIVEGGWAGTGNVDEDPEIVDPAGGDFSLRPFSPALDAAFGGPLAKPGVSPADLAAAFGMDAEGAARADLPCVPDSGTGAVSHVDRGPLELQAPGPCLDEPVFRRGDSNGDDSADLSDALHMLLILFLGAAESSCDDARDANDDGLADISDPIYLLDHLFVGATAPPPPYLDAGMDPTADPLGCERG